MGSVTSLLTQGFSGLFIHALASILLRWCVSLGSYSGKGKPPMYGDYEAQRHWQEITFNLPVQSWYTNSSLNNMQYWGLDYPPLTAYHSWLCGYVAYKINPSWVELDASRGTEDYLHKLFMRHTVLAGDLLVLFPALILLWYLSNQNKQNSITAKTPEYLLLSFFYPGLILIDHGHFQYNNISLGLMIWALLAFDKHFDKVGSVFFTLSLNYKQMELYHALPIFFFLLGKCFKHSLYECIKRIIQLGITVVVCFAILWAPFLSSLESTFTVVQRLFPVNRGLYEDKVANFWCSIAPILKFKEIMNQQSILQMCAVTTFLLSTPSCLHLFIKPSMRNLKYSLVNVSLVFFLFSYQVHEKSVLIPALSACLLYDEVPPLLVTWFLHFTVFSMSPLLYKDELTMQLVALSVIFLMLCACSHGFREESIKALVQSLPLLGQSRYAVTLTLNMFQSSVIMSAILILLPFVYKPPPHLPDLIPVCTSAISCFAFLLFAVIFHYLQFVTIKPIEPNKND